MSLVHNFVATAQSAGLYIPGAPGSALVETTDYRDVIGQYHRRQSMISQIRAKGGMAGVKFDAKIHDLDAWARAGMWAEYLAEQNPKGGTSAQRFSDGIACAMAYRVDGRGSATSGWRKDAIVPMASQGLTEILPQVYEYQHNDLPCWDEQILKTWSGADPAANEIVWYEMDNVGVARASTSYDITTIPMVNGPIASDNKILIMPALVGMATNFMDPRREAMARSNGKPDFQIEAMKRRAAERSLAEFFDNLWFGGDPMWGIDGLMNNPYVETVSITGGAWSAKTALQILDDLKTMAWAIYNATAGQLKKLSNIRIILPPSQYQLLIQPITSAGDRSIMGYFNDAFKDTALGVPKIQENPRLASANSYAYNGGPNILARDTALIIYEDGDQLADPKFVLTQRIEVPAPVRNTGLGDVTYFHARGGGMRLPDARRLKYVTGL